MRTWMLLVSIPVVFAVACASPASRDYKDIRVEYRQTLGRIAPIEGKAGPSATRAVARTVSLSEAIGIALANNPDKMMAAARIRQAEAMIDAALSAFMPAMSLYTEYVEGDAPSTYLFKKIDQRKLPPDTNFNDPGRIENFETGVTARLNLFNGGRDLLAARMAETGATIAELDRRAIDNSLVASVIQSYYNALAARDFIAIARESVATVQEQLRVMNVRFKAGGALKSDILSLDVRLAQARENLVQRDNQHQTALAALSNVLGVSPEPPLELSGAEDLSLSLPETYLGGVAHAIAHRPEMEKVRRQVVRSRMAIDQARAGYLPVIDAQGKYYLDDPDMDYDTDRGNWTVGVTLTWNFFDGFRTRAEARQAEAVLEEMLAADRRGALSIRLDVKNAYLSLHASAARLKVARASVANAEESLELVRQQYEGGSATITRYLEAELDRNRARTRAAAAYYDREKALADIGRAIGLWASAMPAEAEAGGKS